MDEIELVAKDGSIDKVNLITYLNSDDGTKQYVVYSKNESYGSGDDKIIYISRLTNIDNVLYTSEISDNLEWDDVQKLLRRLANKS